MRCFLIARIALEPRHPRSGVVGSLLKLQYGRSYREQATASRAPLQAQLVSTRALSPPTPLHHPLTTTGGFRRWQLPSSQTADTFAKTAIVVSTSLAFPRQPSLREMTNTIDARPVVRQGVRYVKISANFLNFNDLPSDCILHPQLSCF